MSDFLSDDFTAELRSYFLDQFLNEVQKYVESSDEESWEVFRDEILEKTPEWTVDAKSNEFSFFAAWFEQLVAQLKACEDFRSYKAGLQLLQSYLQKLSQQKKDSAELATQFAVQETAGHLVSYLHCRIGPQELVLPVHQVVEVITRESLFALPLHSTKLAGLIPYRGEAIPVFNLQAYGFQALPENGSKYFVVCDVVADAVTERFAFQVSGAELLMQISSKELQAKNAETAIASARFISHFVVRESKNIMVFDLAELVAA